MDRKERALAAVAGVKESYTDDVCPLQYKNF